MLNGISNGHAVSVADFPVAWKIEAVNDAKHQNFEYVRYGLTFSTTTPALLTLCSKNLLGIDKHGLGPSAMGSQT
jgi:hypothetical protein